MDMGDVACVAGMAGEDTTNGESGDRVSYHCCLRWYSACLTSATVSRDGDGAAVGVLLLPLPLVVVEECMGARSSYVDLAR